MATDHLLGNYAPIPAKGGSRSTTRQRTASPPGWPHAAGRLVGAARLDTFGSNLGRTASLDSTPPGTKCETVVARQRRVLALTELRVSFTVECSGLQDAERGAADID
jgi:hypothetical protein